VRLTAATPCVTRDSSPIAKPRLTHPRDITVRFRNHHASTCFSFAPLQDDLRPAFDIVDADFSAAGVREISFGNTYPVKARERRGEETRIEKGGGWIGWALFRSGTNKPVSAVRQTAQGGQCAFAPRRANSAGESDWVSTPEEVKSGSDEGQLRNG